ncbi:hypothetical protein IFU37_008745 [Pantoea agglomerans]|uniref:hypothetical protein n=1 Tax=Enterobacter agglomerans TaxID=549 RepID=UPI00177B1A14|nr:hypothetical protein [Pantoea agglomerans]WVL91411.1 hypothetical protein IFU37_008745 [Pantoea agglomerans]
MSESWFVRFTITANGHTVEIFTILTATSARHALEELITTQMGIHGIQRSDIDILVMNKV